MIHELDLEGRPVTMLGYEAGLTLPTLRNPGPITVVGETPEGVTPTRRVGFREYAAGGASFRAERVLVVGVARVGLAGILAALRHGGRVFHVVHRSGEFLTFDRAGALRVGAVRSVRRRLGKLPAVPAVVERGLGHRLDPPWATRETSLAAVRRAIAWAAAHPTAAASGERLRIVHYVGSLGPGGAERQLTYLATAQRAAGHEVRVWAATPLVGDRAHYRPTLEAAGIPVDDVPVVQRNQALPAGLSAWPAELIDALDRHWGAEQIFPLLLRLRQHTTDVLHCWLNEQNVFGAVAGLVAGVPRLVLSTRNVSPRHFPRLDRPDYAETYGLLGEAPSAALIGNSAAGVADYAAWSGLDPGRFAVVLNGFASEGARPADPAERAAARARLGVADDAYLVVGVFRLDVEKRPLDFVRVLARARERVPGLQALHLGVGPLQAEAKAEADRLGLGDALRFLGRRDDPLEVMRVADATLLTSENEGCPNVSLESQAVGVPVVLTDGGGAAETVRVGETGLVRPVGDLAGLADDLVRLAEQPDLRRRLSAAGPAWIAERFGRDRMVSETMAVYR